MFYLKNFIIIFSLIAFVSCSNDESDPNEPINRSPDIINLSANPSILYANETTNLTCNASDEDNDVLTYTWNAIEGSFPNGNSGQVVEWKAPEIFGDFIIEISVSDNQVSVKDSIVISVIDDPCDEITSFTYDGTTYNTVSIGKQCWMRENLNVGFLINDSLEMTNNDTIEKYCYDNDVSNCDKYGGLYQWKEAMKYLTEEGVEGICPNGWHLPTFAELRTLKQAVNGSSNSLKAIGQGNGIGIGENSSGFSALLGGMRYDDTNFGNIGDYGIYWSSTIEVSNFVAAFYLSLNSGDDNILLDRGDINTGVSARCLKDEIL